MLKYFIFATVIVPALVFCSLLLCRSLDGSPFFSVAAVGGKFVMFRNVCDHFIFKCHLALLKAIKTTQCYMERVLMLGKC